MDCTTPHHPTQTCPDCGKFAALPGDPWTGHSARTDPIAGALVVDFYKGAQLPGFHVFGSRAAADAWVARQP
jgi:hypothetical protein